MKDLPDQLFRHFGLKAVVAIVIAGMVIWTLAHWSAAPGRSVSVLWGLVEYTKSSSSGENQQESVSIPPIVSRPHESIVMPTVSPIKESGKVKFLEGKRKGKVEVVAHGYSKASWSTGRPELRKLRGLRELSALESGKPMNSMPGGTFGFVNFLDVMVMKGESELGSALPHNTVRRFESKDSSGPQFEIHCDRQADRLLLGFTTETTASGLSSSSSSGINEVVLAAQPQVDLISLVLIDMRLLRSGSLRLIEAGSGEPDWVMDLVLW
jgi:hypothetical protein